MMFLQRIRPRRAFFVAAAVGAFLGTIGLADAYQSAAMDVNRNSLERQVQPFLALAEARRVRAMRQDSMWAVERKPVAGERDSERHTKVMALARKLHMTPAFVEQNYDDLAKASDQHATQDAMAGVSPTLRDWLTDPDNASISARHTVEATAEAIVESEYSGILTENPALAERWRTADSACFQRIVSRVTWPTGTARSPETAALSAGARQAMLADRSCGAFYEPTIARYLWRYEPLSLPIDAAAAIFILCLAVSWVSTYPQAGWRRLAVVLGPLGALVWLAATGADKAWNNAASLSTTVGLAVALCVLVLKTRDVVEWIRRGFTTPPGAGEP